jgi:flagellar hook-associated protein 1
MAGLSSALSAAASGLRTTQTGIELLSRNISNAASPGYTRKFTEPQNLVIGGEGYGVRSGDVSRLVDGDLQRSVRQNYSEIEGSSVQDQFLARLELVFGRPGDSSSVASRMNSLGNAFRSLVGNPESVSAQQTAVSKAQELARSFNDVANTIQGLRTDAESAINAAVKEVNGLLTELDALNTEIVSLKAIGRDTPDLEDQRDSKVDQLSKLMGITYFTRDNGELRILTTSGRELLTAQPHLLSFSPSGSVPPTSAYPAALNGVMLDGVDLFAPPPSTPPFTDIGTGKLAALADLRDRLLPQAQLQVDELASVLTLQFAALVPPLEIFRDGAIAYNPLNRTGYAQRIVVNPAVVANVWRVRDGTVVGVPNTVNPSDATLPLAVIGMFDATQTFAGAAGLGTAHSFENYSATFLDFQAAQRATFKSVAESQQISNEALRQRLLSESGVNIDQEMSLMVELQNSYAANARVIQALKDMFDELISIG